MMNMNDPNVWLADSSPLGAMNDKSAWTSGTSEPFWKSSQNAMQDPRQRVMMAMLAQQLAKAGHGLAGGQPAPHKGPSPLVPGFDLYGMPTQ